MELFHSIEIETYSYCNLSCPYCPVSLYKREKQYLEEKYFCKLIDELSSIDYQGTLSPHFFNEPFADDRIFDLMEYASQKLKNAKIIIFTNTTLLTPEKLRKMSQNNIYEYVVTIDSEIIAKSYKRLMDQLNPEERIKIRTRSIFKEGMYNRAGLIKSIQNTHKLEKCFAPKEYCVINSSGNLLLCYNDFFSNFSFGNIKTNSLLDIWNHQHFKKSRQEISEGFFKYQICKECECF